MKGGFDKGTGAIQGDGRTVLNVDMVVVMLLYVFVKNQNWTFNSGSME